MYTFLLSVTLGVDNTITGTQVLQTDLDKNFKVTNYNLTEFKNLKCENAKVKGKDLISLNGAIDRYPTFLPNRKTNNIDSIIILCRTKYKDEKGFCVSNYKGDIRWISEKEAVKLAKSCGIVNGKIVSGYYISAIRGNYLEIEKIEYLENNYKNEKEVETNEMSVLKPYNYGLDVIKSCAPKNLSSLVSNQSWLQISDTIKNNLIAKKHLFENCVLDFNTAEQLVNAIGQDGAMFDNYLAQIIKGLTLIKRK